MQRRHQDVLTRNRTLLLKNLKVTNMLLACLREDYTLTEEMQEEIDAERKNSEKVSTLLDTLVRRGDKAFDRFIRALAETDQDQVALALDKDLGKKYINERNSNRMGVQQSTEPNDKSRGLSSGQPTPLQMPVVCPMQNTPDVLDGMVQTLPTANLTSASTSSPSGSLNSVTATTPVSSVRYSADDIKAFLAEIHGKDVKEIMDIDIKPATNLHEVEDPMVYQMRSLPRGRAVIINNRYFLSSGVNKLEAREGAEHDRDNLKQLFEKLSFTVIVEENKTAQQIRDFLTAESRHQDHVKADAFVLFLLSHGNQGNVFGLDGKELSIEDDITTLFDPDHCPALKGKPKIFFIQACQGKLTEFAPDSDSDPAPELDENLVKNREKLEIVDKEGFVPGFHKKSDMVMSYATVKGYLAWRNPDAGSWFVRCLVSVFSRRAHFCHLIDMLTETNFLLSQLQSSKQDSHSRQLAEKTDTLIKKLYFFPVSASKSD